MSLCPSSLFSSSRNIPLICPPRLPTSVSSSLSLATTPKPLSLVNCSDSDPIVGGGGCDGVDDGWGPGGGGGRDGVGDNEDEADFGPLLKFEEVVTVAELRKVRLPEEFSEAATAGGIRQAFIERYLELPGSVWPLGWLMKHCPMLRNRMLADPSFLFKFGTELFIDSCCATLAEVQKRGKDFWAEFKFVFKAERPGCRFTIQQRIATYFYKEYQEIRRGHTRSASFAECRTQIVNGLERVVEGSPLAKSFLPATMAFTVGVRFASNIYGGMQFVDWAKWSGVQ